jgi:hypothetical protein
MKVHLKHRAPNVLACISRSTSLSYWVATMILLADRQDRVKIAIKMIKVAKVVSFSKEENTYQMTAFNGDEQFQHYDQFTGGINNDTCLSPQKHFCKVARKAHEGTQKILLKSHFSQSFEEIEELMNTKSSYKSYRERLKRSKPPLLPYL